MGYCLGALILGVACFAAVRGGAAGARLSRGTQDMHVSTLEYGNVLPQYAWMCKTDGAEFNPSGYCTVAADPPYRRKQPHPPPCQVEVDPSCPDHGFDGLWNFTRTTTLPYTVQDTYGREQAPAKVPVVTLESDTLKATITPQWGGRLWGLLDKRTGRDLFFNNKYFQPNNDALRQAYLQGGAEWNFGSQMGHMSQTADGISAARIRTERGDVARVFGFERISRAVWQVDMHIEERERGGGGGDASDTGANATAASGAAAGETGAMWLHVKLTNPNPYPTTGYWWTNIGVHHDRVPLPGDDPDLAPAPKDVRILTPAKNWISDAGIAAYPPWPYFIGSNWMATGAWTDVEAAGDWSFPRAAAFDHSYAKNWWEKCDVWLTDVSVLERHINYNGYVNANGSSMIHAHPNNGTKAWIWGQAPNERYWQDFGGDKTKKDQFNHYTELQTGVMPTQYQGFEMAPGEVREWTELIQPVPGLDDAGRVARLNDPDYHGVAIEEVERIMAAQGVGQRNASHFDAMDAWLRGVGAIQPEAADLLAEQQGWAGLEMLRTGRKTPLAAGALFAPPGEPGGGPLDDEMRPWHELVTRGTFSNATLAAHVTSFMVHPEWLALLNESAARHGDTWLHQLHLGIGALERVGVAPTGADASFTAAVAHFTRSLALRETAEAHRNLAVTSAATRNFTAAHAHYQRAMALATAGAGAGAAGSELLVRNLAAEVAQFLQLVSASASAAPELLPALADFVSLNNTLLPADAPARRQDRFRMAEVAAELYAHRNYERVYELCDCSEGRQWPTLGFDLSSLKAWYRQAKLDQEAERRGRELSTAEKNHVIRSNPVPVCLRAIGH